MTDGKVSTELYLIVFFFFNEVFSCFFPTEIKRDFCDGCVHGPTPFVKINIFWAKLISKTFPLPPSYI